MSIVKSHSAEIPDTALKQRSIDGTHPITREKGAIKPSAQFKNYRVQLKVFEEATSRELRKLALFTGEDEYGNPIVEMEIQGCGRGYTPNKKLLEHPILNENMNRAVVKFDRETKKPYTAFPVSNRKC
ncbi:hypothetical protein [Pseudomonas tolaasii]|uniref:Uncharacterized protein n=1 Tax=Pseudomonas tolaasii NCPPB 2192 TaxID=564423 RepID=A0ABX4QN14_PSETO|nr:hypothetical protein [Pseudomonas tolaasii]PKA78210.1 hypothetical protein ATI14_5299 [Pseudomonas tolaasii NCPPB 2192]